VRGVEVANRRALRQFMVALLVVVTLVLGVLVGVGAPLPLLGAVLGLAVLVAVVPRSSALAVSAPDIVSVGRPLSAADMDLCSYDWVACSG
jgi:hypothetical protein